MHVRSAITTTRTRARRLISALSASCIGLRFTCLTLVILHDSILHSSTHVHTLGAYRINIRSVQAEGGEGGGRDDN